MIKVKKGLNLPISGVPKQELGEAKTTSKYAVIGNDFNGMKPTMKVQVGDIVGKGSILFTDKKNPGVIFTSPVSGEIVEINRGEKRAFESIVIKKKGDEKHSFSSFKKGISSREEVVNLLVESGEWTSIKTRPYSKSAKIDSKPKALFINAMDTNPLAPSSALWIKKHIDFFKKGVEILSHLTDGKTYVCTADEAGLNLSFSDKNIQVESFSGPHPAGNSRKRNLTLA